MMRRTLILLLVLAVALLPAPEAARAEKHSLESLKNIVLGRTGTILVPYADDALGEYNARDGKLVRTFAIAGKLWVFGASWDESKLAMVGWDGSVTLWDLKAGRRRWTTASRDNAAIGFVDAAIGIPADVSFSQDGTSLAVAAKAVLVYDTRSGAVKVITAEGLNAWSAALAPNGKKGVAISVNEKNRTSEIWAFDVVTGKAQKTDRTAYVPVRYSADGKHIACQSNRIDGREDTVSLRVVSLTKGQPFKDIGKYSDIMYLQPTAGGAFDYYAATSPWGGIMARYDPHTGRVKELWQTPQGLRGEGGAFNAEAGILAYTDFKWTSHIADLKSGKLIEIDNSGRWPWRYEGKMPLPKLPPHEKPAESLPDPTQRSLGSPGFDTEPAEAPALPWWGGLMMALGAFALLVLFGWALKRRRSNSIPAAK